MDQLKTEAHYLVNLNSANGVGIPLSMYVELGIEFIGHKMLRVRFLNTQNQNEVLDPETEDKAAWHHWMEYQEFTKDMTPVCLKILNACNK